MADLLILDLDRTVARFPATSRLCKRLFLKPASAVHLAWAVVMLGLMHGLWFVPAAVRLQRRIVMSLFAQSDQTRLTQEVEVLVDDAVYLVTHAPEDLARGVAKALQMTGHVAIPVADYLGGAPGEVFDKTVVLDDLRGRYPAARTFYFADDLVDLPALRAADVGTLVNGSWFSRLVCRLFFRDIRIWS